MGNHKYMRSFFVASNIPRYRCTTYRLRRMVNARVCVSFLLPTNVYVERDRIEVDEKAIVKDRKRMAKVTAPPIANPIFGQIR